MPILDDPQDAVDNRRCLVCDSPLLDDEGFRCFPCKKKYPDVEITQHGIDLEVKFVKALTKELLEELKKDGI